MIALIAITASAADHEVSIELGSLHNGDEHYDVYQRGDQMPSWGLSAGVKFHDRLAVVGSWHRVRRGSDILLVDYEESFEEANIGRSAFIGDEFTLGVKGDFQVTRWFLPYASVEAMLLRATVRFDDDPDDNESPGQLSNGAAAPGGLFALGIELRIPKGDAPFTIAFTYEVGYGLVAQLNFSELGDIQPGGGLAMRSGLGVRF